MSFFFSGLQLFGWVSFGWFLNEGNVWACVASALFSVLSGLMVAIDSVGKAMINGTTNQSK